MERKDVSGFGDLRILHLPGDSRAEVSGIVSVTEFVSVSALRLGTGAPLWIYPTLDLGLYYRPALIDYEADIQSHLEHRFGVEVALSPITGLEVAATIEGATGADAAGLGLFTTAIWRPQL
jgi:hypothetical protein